MKDLLEEMIGPALSLLMLWFIVSFIQAVNGVDQAEKPSCSDKARHIEVLFPGYRVGCWLGERFK